MQGKLLRTEFYEGASTLKRSEDKLYNYAESDRPYPGTMGASISANSPPYPSENVAVMRKNVMTQQGRIFTWEVPTASRGWKQPVF